MKDIFKGTEAEIYAIPDPQNDDIAYAVDTSQAYCYKDDHWMNVTQDAEFNVHMSLYDMNKQIVAQLPTLTGKEIMDKLIGVNTLHEHFKNNYYMLYGKEISYFTLFKIEDAHNFPADVLECLDNIGEIKAIDSTAAGDALEIWVLCNDEAVCLYLFPYDAGLVVVGG